ncbi:hypothetical protein MLD38_034440 [Melastoma candidum]|uniref:Uncharacterized protein n=1 Tax=Melastoma candidum TaxID=119954 RepID=A0ACB9MDL9_9MYRT|nr:hypothetical protein MLD38_034440 [Melastoma candidum]
MSPKVKVLQAAMTSLEWAYAAGSEAARGLQLLSDQLRHPSQEAKPSLLKKTITNSLRSYLSAADVAGNMPQLRLRAGILSRRRAGGHATSLLAKGGKAGPCPLALGCALGGVGQCVVGLVRDNVDEKLRLSNELVLVSEIPEYDFIKGIGEVADKLAKEDLLATVGGIWFVWGGNCPSGLGPRGRDPAADSFKSSCWGANCGCPVKPESPVTPLTIGTSNAGTSNIASVKPESSKHSSEHVSSWKSSACCGCC